MKFKVGDWVIEKSNGELKQIKIGKSECLERKLALYERLCEPWEPKEGDWCWVSDFNYKGSIPELRQFSRMDGENKVFFKENGMEIVYIFAEPFVYDLPTTIKG